MVPQVDSALVLSHMGEVWIFEVFQKYTPPLRNQFGLLINVAAEVVRGNFRKTHYFSLKFVTFFSCYRRFLEKSHW